MSFKDKVKLKRLVPGLLVAVAIFWLGWAIGSGRIGPDNIFHHRVAKGLPKNLNYSSVEQVYDALRTEYDGQLDVNKLLDGLKKGLVEASGDPYTEYLNAGESQNFDSELSGCFTGIGAQLGKQGDNIVIIAPISGAPADKAGLKAKDVVEEIDGQSTNNLTITGAVNKIRGNAGSTVKLKILRDGANEFEVQITREQVCIPSVTSKVLDSNIGYIKISSFGQDTSDLSQKAAQSFKQSGIKSVILDLRDDPGGLLNSAVDVSGLWLNNKVVLYEKRNKQIVHTYYSNNQPILSGISTVVLINEGSASASEITAGALKDNGAARLIGTKTFGKGSVQQLDTLSDGGELKVTVARWYTPNNINIDKEGIQPDQKVDRSDDDIKNNRDPQLDAALSYLSK